MYGEGDAEDAGDDDREDEVDDEVESAGTEEAELDEEEVDSCREGGDLKGMLIMSAKASDG